MSKEQRKRFLHELAVYLAGESAMKSIALTAGHPWAKEWAQVRAASPVHGWISVEEAERTLNEEFER